MKLYVVTAGCYSEYHICGIFESEEKAKLYVELNDSTDYYNEGMAYHCEETLDDRLMDANDSRKLYSVNVYPDTGKMLVGEDEGYYHLTPDPYFANFHEYRTYDFNKHEDVTVHGIHILANDKDHARKIAQDKYAEYKAEKAGII